MSNQSLAGEARIRITLASGRSMLVGPFLDLRGATRLAEDLTREDTITNVTVEYHHAWRGWQMCWSRSLEVAR